MKKHGYTLAEALITMAIIGVTTALILPAVNSLKPDESKTKFLKVYDSISDTVKDIASNTLFFPTCFQQGEHTFICYRQPPQPFMNVDRIPDPADPQRISTLIPGGNGKLCRLIERQYTGGMGGCSDGYADFRNGRRFSFNTETGESIYVTSSVGGNRAITQIAFDINGNGNPPDCWIGNNGCRKPDTFILGVTPAGDIYPGDRMTEYYLRTRQNVKAKMPNNLNANNNALWNAIPFDARGREQIEDFAYLQQ